MNSLCFHPTTLTFSRAVSVQGYQNRNPNEILENIKNRPLWKRGKRRWVSSSANSRQQPEDANNERDRGAEQSIVVLMRHGITDWNTAGRVQGNLDESRLNEIGIKQATLAGRKLRGIDFDAVYCSPLTRARHTFSILATASKNGSLGNIEPFVLDALTEIQFPWQGLYRQDIKESEFGKLYASYQHRPRLFTFKGFNPLRDIERRAHTVWNHLRSQRSRCALVVAHNQTNKALLSSALGLYTDLRIWNQSNCCVNIFSLSKLRDPVLRLCNCSPSRLRYITHLDFLARRNTGKSSKDDVLEGSKSGKIHTVFKRSSRRGGFARAVLYHIGEKNDGEDEVYYHPQLLMEMGVALVRTVYAVGGALELKLAESLVAAGGAENCHRVSRQWRTPSMTTDDEYRYVYETARYLLDKLRNNHRNESVGIVCGNGFLIAAFFAAAFDLGMRGIDRVWSDAGGVSIIDVAHERNRGPGSFNGSVLECFNAPLDLGDDVLVPYTTPIPFDSP